MKKPLLFKLNKSIIVFVHRHSHETKSFLYAAAFINRPIRTAVGVRIMCCSVTDSEWLAVLAHRGGDLRMLCT